MKYAIYLLTLLLSSGAFSVNAQEEQEIPKPQVALNLGWGAAESEFDFKESLLLTAELQVTYKTNFFSVRGMFISDNDFEKRQLNSYSFLYGFIEDFDRHSIYLASGLSWNHFEATDVVDDGEKQARDYKVLGVPLNVGFNVMLSKRLGFNAQAFYNFNEEDNFIGYYLAFRAQLW